MKTSKSQLWIDSGAQEIHGWLHIEAVRMTEILAQSLDTLDVAGMCVEVGVWKGLYFSAIADLFPSRKLLGLDIWWQGEQAFVQDVLSKRIGSKRFELSRVNSHDLSFSQIKNMTSPDGIAFLSIDGDHTYAGAKNDLIKFSSSLNNGGVIAVDDFLNPGAMGVTHATLEFIKESHFEPIAYVMNKLFITTKGWSEIYRARIQEEFTINSNCLGEQYENVQLHNTLTQISGKSLFAF
jgi:hypothetical protein